MTIYKKHKELDWTDPSIEALDILYLLKSELVEPLLLTLPQPYKPYMLGTTESVYAFGAVPLQGQNDSILNK